MKNSQKGFIVPLLIAIIAILVVGGGVYVYNKEKVEAPVSLIDTNIDKYNKAITQRKSEEQPNLPLGYLIPNDVPAKFKIDEKGTRFTPYSTYWSYKSQTVTSFGPMTEYLQFSEDTKNTFTNYTKTETESRNQVVRNVKTFNYNGSSGAVLGMFASEKIYQTSPLSALEYWLAYDHQGRLLKIHTTDYTNLTPDILIGLLKKMTIAK